MRGVTVPERTEDFTADPVELFFDLAYVFALSQLVGELVHDPTWSGTGKVALLFGLLWLPWSQFTWSANAVSGNGRRVRLLFLLATAVSVPMAASVSTAFESGGILFAISLAGIFGVGATTMVTSFDSGTAIRSSAVQWLASNTVAVTLLLVGAFIDGNGRIVAWATSLGVVLVAMAMAGRGEWLIRTGHMAERHGLIVIIALGEVIVAIGIPVVDALSGDGLEGVTIAVLAAAGAFAGLLWWGYFDRVGPALEHRAEDIDGDQARGRFVRDIYTWCHALIVAGIVASAAALEEIALHPGDAVPTEFRVMLLGGLALSIGGVGLAIWRAFRAITRERIVAGLVVAAFLAGAASLDGLYVVVVLDVVLLVTLMVEHRRIEH